jgi:heat shock protein HslJ
VTPRSMKTIKKEPLGDRSPRGSSWKAGDRIRTGDPQLGKLMLYQLSYTRAFGLKNYHAFEALSRGAPRWLRHPDAPHQPSRGGPRSRWLTAPTLLAASLVFVSACSPEAHRDGEGPCPETQAATCTSLLPVEGGGQEPAWRIHVTETEMTLSLDLGTREVRVPVDAIRAGALRMDLRGARGGRTLEVSILRALCRDIMSGMPHPLTLEVQIDGEPLPTGCGGSPDQLLRDGEDWEVLAVNGEPVLPSTQPTIRFDVADRTVSGNASCNRFRASFERTGESLTVAGPILSTRMACEVPGMDQEERVLRVLSGIDRFDLSPEGYLVLSGSAGDLVARAAARARTADPPADAQ